MKRMSEVFDLPLATGSGRFSSYTVYGDDGKGDCVATFEINDQAQYAVHAINNVDALADALDECLEDMELEGKQDDRVYRLAKAALAAYRGGV